MRSSRATLSARRERPSQRKVFPFLESLLSFTELDIGKVAVALRCISDDLESLDRERVTNAMVKLGGLGGDAQLLPRAVYQVVLPSFRRLREHRGCGIGCVDELRSLPEELPLYQSRSCTSLS